MLELRNVLNIKEYCEKLRLKKIWLKKVWRKFFGPFICRKTYTIFGHKSIVSVSPFYVISVVSPFYVIILACPDICPSK
jgi:hypothetical protein